MKQKLVQRQRNGAELLLLARSAQHNTNKGTQRYRVQVSIKQIWPSNSLRTQIERHWSHFLHNNQERARIGHCNQQNNAKEATIEQHLFPNCFDITQRKQGLVKSIEVLIRHLLEVQRHAANKTVDCWVELKKKYGKI